MTRALLMAVCLSWGALQGASRPHKPLDHPKPSQALLKARYAVRHAQDLMFLACTDTECEAAWDRLEAAKAALAKLEAKP